MSCKAFRVGSAAAVISAAALVAPALAGAAPTGSLGSSDASGGFTCAALSTEATPDGWGIPFDDERDQVAYYSEDSVLDEDGSLRLEVDGPEDRSVSYHAAGGIKLSDAIAHEIGFSERAAQPTASFQLRLTGTTDNERFPDSGFTTLVWVPGAGAADTEDGGTHADLQDGQWWSTSNIAGAHDRAPVPLADIAAANPDAVVDHYGVSVGTGSAQASTLVDQVKFNGCTTNFAKNDAAPTGSLGSLGSLDILGSLNGDSSGS
ncbi:hypothetical protein [Rhodococcus sp. SGAir0479]|uniref:hypothetical protein n=1 Tax=Rhodococcus sp. SGAir0479 TaxID=2567884 RepID=UPI0010CD22B3|nr:hypothetical protein [Rhodococcus sp. SGAir0479]QCQ90212.1 hypothetical protein E7742_02595 [Rhodococcus sp. SGAir0479]